MFRTIVREIEKVVVKGIVFLILAYQFLISSWTGRHCRFYPTCSSYAKAVLREQGVFRGLYFTLRRLLRCHPFYPGGFDPIPKKRLIKREH